MGTHRTAPPGAARSALLALGLVLGGCSAAEPAPPSTGTDTAAAAPAVSVPRSDLRLGPPYRSPDGYEIAVPEGWLHYPIPASEGSSVSFTSTEFDRTAARPIADTLDVGVHTTTKALEDLVAGHLATSAKLIPRFRVAHDRTIMLSDGLPARLLEVMLEIPNLGPQRAFQLLTVRSGNSYVVTVKAAPATFDRFRDTFEKCALSLRLS